MIILINFFDGIGLFSQLWNDQLIIFLEDNEISKKSAKYHNKQIDLWEFFTIDAVLGCSNFGLT